MSTPFCCFLALKPSELPTQRNADIANNYCSWLRDELFGERCSVISGKLSETVSLRHDLSLTCVTSSQTELAYPTQRASLTAIYNTMWYAGTIVAAVSGFSLSLVAPPNTYPAPLVLSG